MLLGVFLRFAGMLVDRALFLQKHKKKFGVTSKNWDNGVRPTTICLQYVEPAQATIATKFILACALYNSNI